MKKPLLFVIALVAAIPAGAHAQVAQAKEGVRVKLPAWIEPVLLDTLRTEHHVAAMPEAVYSAVLKSFFDLGIPVGNTDNKAGIIGSERFERSRTLGGAPMSRWLSCGDNATGPNADSYRLTIAVAVWVKPDKGGGTLLSTAIVASGMDVNGISRNPRECASTGRLEQKIVDLVQK